MPKKKEDMIAVVEDKFNTGETKYYDKYGNLIEKPAEEQDNENKEVEDATN